MRNKNHHDRQDNRDARRAQREEAREYKQQFLADRAASDEYLQRASDELDDAYADWDREMMEEYDDPDDDAFDYFNGIFRPVDD
jgi:hypothetical protein